MKVKLGLGAAALFFSLPALAAQPLLPDTATPVCRDMIGFELRLQQFIDDVRAITAPVGDGRVDLSSSASALALFERQAGSVSGEARQQLCASFERQPMLTAAATVARQQLALARVPDAGDSAEGSFAACLPTEGYLGLFAAQQVLQGFAAIAEALSDASNCPVYTGVVACVPADAICTFNGPLAALATSLAQAASVPLTLDDNCRENRRNATLDALIDSSSSRLTRINQDLQQTLLPRIDRSVSQIASGASFSEFDGRMQSGLAQLDQRLGALEQTVSNASDNTQQADTTAMRLSIEIALQRGGLGVATLQLPAAAGGQLELVRELVAASVLELQALGEDVSAALARVGEGDAALNQGDFRTAYSAYQDAYRLAAALPPEVLR